MASLGLHLLFALACCHACAGAFTDIVLFGDSLSDDCTHGASDVVDEVLDTDQVPVWVACFFGYGLHASSECYLSTHCMYVSVVPRAAILQRMCV